MGPKWNTYSELIWSVGGVLGRGAELWKRNLANLLQPALTFAEFNFLKQELVEVWHKLFIP